MRLRVLGCSGTYPTTESPSSGYVISDPTATVWIDCGTGTFTALQSVMDYADVDALVITHVHSDHVLDIYPLYYARRFDGRCDRLPVYCPAGTEAHLSQFLVGDGASKLSYVFDFREVAEGDLVEIGDLRVTFATTDHPVPTNAVRVDGTEASFVFSSDTGPGMDLHDFARGADVLLCEASYQSDDMGPPLHLSAGQAADYAKRAEVGTLVLTHFWPTHDRQRSLDEATAAAGDVPVTAAYAGGVFDISERRWV